MNKKIIFTLIYFFSLYSVFAGDIPSRPYPPRLVNDFTGIFNQNEQNILEKDLVAFDDSTGVQICVVTVSDFGDYTRAEYADILGENWGVGRKKLNNGIVILIKPTGGNREREVHISVGYGLESVLPDAICKRIVEVEMIPSFEKKAYYEGLSKGIKVIKELSIGEYPPEAYKKKTEKNSFLRLIPFIIFIVFYIFLAKSKNSHSTFGGGNTLLWTILMMMGSSRGGGGGSGGGWGNFTSGGGGFGGFGGGSFGGGGAGGSW